YRCCRAGNNRLQGGKTLDGRFRLTINGGHIAKLTEAVRSNLPAQITIDAGIVDKKLAPYVLGPSSRYKGHNKNIGDCPRPCQHRLSKREENEPKPHPFTYNKQMKAKIAISTILMALLFLGSGRGADRIVRAKADPVRSVRIELEGLRADRVEIARQALLKDHG